MRIVFVLHQFYPEFSGGTERVTLNLARMAQHAGHHVQVLATAVDPDACSGKPAAHLPDAFTAVHQGVPVNIMSRKSLPDPADTRFETDRKLAGRLARWMKRERFEVMHLMHPMRMGSAILAAQQCALPYLVTLSDFFLPCARVNLVNLQGALCPGPDEGRQCARDCPTGPAGPVTMQAYSDRYRQARSVLEAAGARVAPSLFVAQRYREFFPGLEFAVIPHGLDMPGLAAAGAGAKPNPPGAPLALAFIGSIVPPKGLDVLLRALALVPQAPLRLRIMGGFYGNAAYDTEIRELASRDSRIEFTGELDSPGVFRQIAQTDLLCLPSRVPESYSLVLHECSAAGVPALVSDCGAPAEHVNRYGCGQAVATGDPRAWADALASVLSAPQVLRQWRERLPLPPRLEEEAFFYESMYRRVRKIAA